MIRRFEMFGYQTLMIYLPPTTCRPRGRLREYQYSQLYLPLTFNAISLDITVAGQFLNLYSRHLNDIPRIRGPQSLIT